MANDYDLDHESGLTRKQRSFCDNYLAHLNPRFAYHQAGYTSANPDTARKDANALLKLPDVHSWVDLKMKERAERLSVAADRVILELVIVAYADITDYRICPDSGWVEARPGVPRETLRRQDGQGQVGDAEIQSRRAGRDGHDLVRGDRPTRQTEGRRTSVPAPRPDRSRAATVGSTAEQIAVKHRSDLEAHAFRSRSGRTRCLRQQQQAPAVGGGQPPS